MENCSVDGIEIRDHKFPDGSEAPHVLYLCDKRSCANGCNTHSLGKCQHTSDIRHAKNFEMTPHGVFRERQAEGI